MNISSSQQRRRGEMGRITPGKKIKKIKIININGIAKKDIFQKNPFIR